MTGENIVRVFLHQDKTGGLTKTAEKVEWFNVEYENIDLAIERIVTQFKAIPQYWGDLFSLGKPQFLSIEFTANAKHNLFFQTTLGCNEHLSKQFNLPPDEERNREFSKQLHRHIMRMETHRRFQFIEKVNDNFFIASNVISDPIEFYDSHEKTLIIMINSFEMSVPVS